jgi:hypothetical protein
LGSFALDTPAAPILRFGCLPKTNPLKEFELHGKVCGGYMLRDSEHDLITRIEYWAFRLTLLILFLAGLYHVVRAELGL